MTSTPDLQSHDPGKILRHRNQQLQHLFLLRIFCIFPPNALAEIIFFKHVYIFLHSLHIGVRCGDWLARSYFCDDNLRSFGSRHTRRSSSFLCEAWKYSKSFVGVFLALMFNFMPNSTNLFYYGVLLHITPPLILLEYRLSVSEYLEMYWWCWIIALTGAARMWVNFHDTINPSHGMSPKPNDKHRLSLSLEFGFGQSTDQPILELHL